MTTEPGKYDHECAQAFRATKAKTVLLMVIGGEKGNGFSVQSLDPHCAQNIPMLLTHMAHQIEDQLAAESN